MDAPVRRQQLNVIFASTRPFIDIPFRLTAGREARRIAAKVHVAITASISPPLSRALVGVIRYLLRRNPKVLLHVILRSAGVTDTRRRVVRQPTPVVVSVPGRETFVERLHERTEAGETFGDEGEVHRSLCEDLHHDEAVDCSVE